MAAGNNDFVPFATAPGASVMPLATYKAAPQVATGVVSGLADPTLANRSWRQSSFIAAGVAQFVANAGLNVNDDGNLTTFVTNFTAAIAQASGSYVFASNPDAMNAAITNEWISPATLNYVIGQRALLLTGGKITGNLTVTGTVTAGALASTGGLNVSGGLVVLPAGSVAAAALAGGIGNGQLAAMPPATAKANPGGVAAPPQDVAISALLADGGYVKPLFAHFQGQTADGVDGGENLLGNQWTPRLLNWADPLNTLAGLSLAANQVGGVPPGLYKVRALAPQQAAGGSPGFRGQLRIRDITNGKTVVVGPVSSHPGTSGEEGAVLCEAQGLYHQAGPGNTTVEVDTYSDLYGASGGGAAGAGEVEVWSDLMLEKVG